MKPTLILPFIHSYGLMLAAGFYAAWWLAAWRAKAEDVDPDTIGNLVLISILAGVAGARLLWYVLEGAPSGPWWMIFEVWKGGLVFYGGLAGAAIGDFVYLRWRRLNAGQIADIVAPSVAIGQAFGRIGCFLNGCCFGGVCGETFPLGMGFPSVLNPEGGLQGSPAFLQHVDQGWVQDAALASLPVHPTQLYASASLFMIAMVLIVATPYKRRHGEILALVCILNALSRLGMELVRRDAESLALGLTAGQIGAGAVLAFGLALFAWARRRGSPVAWAEKSS
jgi:phosphatidylglycerol:prolipoprotein diacylglycerol transferase